MAQTRGMRLTYVVLCTVALVAAIGGGYIVVTKMAEASRAAAVEMARREAETRRIDGLSEALDAAKMVTVRGVKAIDGGCVIEYGKGNVSPSDLFHCDTDDVVAKPLETSVRRDATGVTSVTYCLSNDSGERILTRSVTVQDTNPPMVEVDESDISVESGAEFDPYANVHVTDKVDGQLIRVDVAPKPTYRSNGHNTYEEGWYVVTIRDADGNEIRGIDTSYGGDYTASVSGSDRNGLNMPEASWHIHVAEPEPVAAAPSQPARPAAEIRDDLSVGEEVAALAVNMADGATPDEPVIVPAGTEMRQWTNTGDPRVQNECRVMDATLGRFGGNNAYASCTQAAAGVLAATVDPDLAGPNTGNGGPSLMLQWLQSHPDVYRELGPDEELRPGDVLSTDGQTGIWVGNEAVRRRFPDSPADTYEACFETSAYAHLHQFGGRNGCRVFRPYQKDPDPSLPFIDYKLLIQ